MYDNGEWRRSVEALRRLDVRQYVNCSACQYVLIIFDDNGIITGTTCTNKYVPDRISCEGQRLDGLVMITGYGGELSFRRLEKIDE